MHLLRLLVLPHAISRFFARLVPALPALIVSIVLAAGSASPAFASAGISVNSVTTPSAGTYKATDVLSFTVNFTDAVTVTGTPRLALYFGPTRVYATYTSVGSTSTALKFNYTVQVGDNAGAGIILWSSLDLNGGTITATMGGSAAIINFTAPSGNSIVIDGVAPAIVLSPGSRSIGIGGTSKTTLTVAATGNNLSYQWRKNTDPVNGATTATYTIGAVKVADAGSYDCVVTNPNGSATSNAGTLTILPNPVLYAGSVTVGANGVTAHFAIEGSSSKTLVIAAYGPALGGGGISDPQIAIVNGSGSNVASNDNWGTIVDGTFSSTYTRLGLPALANNSNDAVVYQSFAPGSYTVTVTGVGGSTGAALLTIADADLNPTSRLAYVAIRGPVAVGSPLIGAFKMTNTASKKLLFRAIGPSLASGGLADPALTLYDSNGTTVITSNDNWGGTSPLKTAFTQAGAFALADASKDAVVLGNQTIGTGSYSAQVTTVSGTGDALFEVYDLDGENNSTFAPTVSSPLANVTASAGPVSFTVGAAGGSPLSYAWKRGSTPIPSATTATLTLATIGTSDAGTYTATVTNTAGTTTSSALLKVTPAVNSAGIATATYGTAFTYNITGTNSPTSYNATGLPTGLSINTSTGAITGSPTQTGSFTATLSATNADGTGTASLALTVDKKALTIAGVTASNKIYDRDTTATLNTGSASLTGVVSGDTVTLLTASAAASFADKTVATGKTVTISGFALSGTDAGKYTLTQPAATADITAKALTVTGVAASDKTYDGGTVATLSTGSAALSGVISGDTVTLGNGTGAFATSAVGSGKTVTTTGFSLSGADAANYSVTQPTTTASITAKSVTIAGVTAGNKTYDGGVTATLGGTASLTGVLGGDSSNVTLGGTATGSFATKAIGSDKTVTITGYTLTGSAAANYSLTQPTAAASITAKSVTITGVTAQNKEYDRTSTATLSTGSAALSGAIGGDSVSVTTIGATGAFPAKTIGTGLTVTTTGFGLAGADAGNYTLTQPTTTADITAKALTVSGITATSRAYNQGTVATLVTGSAELSGVISGDTVALNTGSAAGAFANKNIGTVKTVTVTGLALTGTDAGNYTITAPTPTADITAVALTVSGITASNKTYDGLLAATINSSAALLSAPLGVEVVTLVTGSATGSFATKVIGTGKTVTIAGLSLAGVDAGNYVVTAPTTTADITAAALTIAGVTASDKTYDALVTATLNTGSAALVGKVTGDDVTLSVVSATGTFANKNVGTGKTVTTAGFNVSGGDAGNYTLTQPTTTASISAHAASISGATASNKTYDGTVTAAIATNGSLVGIIGDDVVTLATGSATGAFSSKTVGTGKTVTFAGFALTGTDAGNYSLTQPTTTANITAKGLTVAGTTATTKVYNANTTATAVFTGSTLVGVVSGDTVTLVSSSATATFATKTVGTGKTVTVAGLTLGGTDAANYTLTQPTTTADITAKNLTVAGVTASSKVYNGTTSATLNFGSASLVGIAGDDTVTLVTGSATGTFSTANAGINRTVQVAGLTLGGTDAANYTVTQPSTTANITPASASIAISNTSFTYDGTPKSATITVTPAVATSIVYSNGGSAPTNAGTYTVSVNVTDSNYSASANATLTIAKAAQTVAFTIAGASFNVGSTLTLNATASSGLPVTFALVSGSATLSGSSVTITQAGAVSIRATQAGNDNYLAATADQGFTGVSTTKTAQTIAFGALTNVTADAGVLTLSATASSGLPVSFTLVSGPATLVGTNTLVLSGGSGLVVVRASQAGNTTFAAAPDVVRSFAVTPAAPNLFFGDLVDDPGISGDNRGELIQSGGPRLDAKSGDIAAVFYTDTRRGNIIIVAPSLSLNVALDFVVSDAGTYSVAFTSAGRSLTLTGALNGTTLTGRIAALKVSFTTQVLAKTGTTAGIAGFYDADALNTAKGGTSSIVGPNGQLLIVATAGDVSTGALGSVGADGKFNVSAPGATIAGAVDAATTTVAGTITVPGQSAVSFSGLAVTTSRTDRLVNLSSRVRVGPSAGRTLITGFVIGGTADKRVLLRATGPALTGFGVQGALSNPRLQLFDGTGKLILENDDWSGAETSSTAAQVGAFALVAGSKDAAIVTTLKPGAYTMQVIDGGETGIALAEIYDASDSSATESQRLINISTRGEAGAGENVLIGGFIVTGNAPKTVLVRGVGPGLAAFGVGGTLADPRLRVYGATGLIAENDNWSTVAADATATAAAATQTGAFTLASGSKDAAIILTLNPGAYTAQVGAADGTSVGVALVEIYELP
jgi:hypothetical protein